MDPRETINGEDEDEEVEVPKSDGQGLMQEIRFKLTITTQYEMDASYDNNVIWTLINTLLS